MFKKLFGRKPEPQAEAVPLKDGFSVIPEPARNGSSFRVEGTIQHEADGVTRARKFIRADSYENAEIAATACIRKAEQIISEQGQSIFYGDQNRPL